MRWWRSGGWPDSAALLAPSPFWGEGWGIATFMVVRGHSCLVTAKEPSPQRRLGSSDFARGLCAGPSVSCASATGPLTQRAFRSSADARVTFLLLAHARAGARANGEAGPKGGGQDALSTNPATRPRTFRASPGRRLIRGALSLGYFSLGKQRKVTRPPAGGRKPAAGEPGRRHATTEGQEQSHWTPAFAGVTVLLRWRGK